jgi:hypothetical protein
MYSSPVHPAQISSDSDFELPIGYLPESRDGASTFKNA